MAKSVDGLRRSKPKVYFEEIKVEHVSFEDLDLNAISHLKYNPEVGTSIVDLLAFIANLPLREQVFMLCNTLTISGFSQREIAIALEIPYQEYRNALWEIRKKFTDSVRAKF